MREKIKDSKQRTKSKDKVVTLIALILFVLIIAVVIFYDVKRMEILEKDFIITKAKITKVFMNTRKGTTSRINVAQYIYEYKGKKHLQTVEIYNRKVLEKTCYEIKVSNINPEINEILLEKKIDCDEEN
ncbi:hypothetical protein [Tenacibaculum sp. 190524A02b]|uniref:hypothetical protein n=1 Tax=Tenacibaculum vairaonense TaxID=3137860 RepID=UPI0031FAC614